MACDEKHNDSLGCYACIIQLFASQNQKNDIVSRWLVVILEDVLYRHITLDHILGEDLKR